MKEILLGILSEIYPKKSQYRLINLGHKLKFIKNVLNSNDYNNF